MKHIGIIWLALMMALAGCSATAAADKAGSTSVVLHLVSLDGGLNNTGQEYGLQAFVDALSQISNGKITGDVTFAYAHSDPNPETAIVKAIASGEVDGGWPATRSFAPAGIPGMQAVEAPFALTSNDAVLDAVKGPVRDQVLGALNATGVKGIGLVIGGLRRFFTDKPLTSVAAWQGLQLRVVEDPVQDGFARAAGAMPVHTDLDWRDKLNSGELKLNGVELAVPIAAASGMPFSYYPTNLVLWPKIYVLSLNRARFDGLTTQQQGWIEAAAKIAEGSSVNGHYNEGEFVQALCDNGVLPYTVPDAALAALRTKVEPVINKLATDPAEAALLASVMKVAGAHPQPDPTLQSATCGPRRMADVPKTTATIPDGKYRVDVTYQDITAARVANNGNYTGTWTLTVADGTYAYTCTVGVEPAEDCGASGAPADYVLEAGYLRGDDRMAYFVYDHAVHDHLAQCGLVCPPNPTKTVGWRLAGDQLTFFDAGQPVIDNLLIIKPWTKVS